MFAQTLMTLFLESTQRWLFSAGLILHLSLAAAVPTIPAAVQSTIRARVDYGYNPAIVVGMVNAEGRAFFSYGAASLETQAPVNEHTLFEVGSVTKVFTALLLSAMAQAGEVSLTNQVREFLPADVTVPSRNGQQITLLHLATHSSGLPYVPPNLEGASALNPFAEYSVARLYEFLNGFTLPRVPGAGYEYSNVGFGLLGHALARHLGISYEAALRQRLLEPMGLIDSTTEPSTEQKSRRATGYTGVVPRPPFEANSLEAAGDLLSSADDMLTFLEYNMGLRTNTVLQPALTDAIRYRRATDLPGIGIGLGWWLWSTPSGEYIQHSGNTIGQSAFIGFRRGSKTGVVVLTNARVNQYAGIDDIGLRLLDSSASLTTIKKPFDVSSALRESYVGAYRASDGTWFNIEDHHGFLTFAFSTAPTAAFTLYPETTRRFTLLELGLSASATFNTNALGQVSSMTWVQSGQTLQYERLSSAPRLVLQFTGAQPELTIAGDLLEAYALEASADLRTWTRIRTNLVAGRILLAPSQSRFQFYRAALK